MENQTRPLVHPANTLRVGSIIQLDEDELEITTIVPSDDWITFRFNKPWWDAHVKEWKWSYGCHFGFCFEVIQL